MLARVILYLLFSLTFISGLHAEDDLRYPFLEKTRPSRPSRVIEPRPRYIAPIYIAPRTGSVNLDNPTRRIRPVRPQTVLIPSVDIEKTPPQATTILTIIGDSWGVQLGQGLREAMSAKSEIGIASKAQSDTGLVNTNVRDWPKFVSDMVAGSERNDVTLMMIGSNDNQPMRDEAGVTVEAGSEKWKLLYTKRVDEIISAFRQKKVPLIWVGAPITKLDKLNANLSVLNSIYKSQVQAAGFTFVETFDVFADREGRYANIGPDINGESVQLRAEDNVHFTKAGARKLAFFVEKDLSALLSGKVLKIEPVNAPSAPQLPVDIQNNVPLLEAAGLSPLLQKREAGAVMSLTGSNVQGADEFAESRDVVAPKSVTEVFIEGKAPYPKPNRGDDFSWPRR